MNTIRPEDVDLSTEIAGIHIPKFVVGPAAGVRNSTEEELHILGRSPSVSVIVMKTATSAFRKGNDEPRLQLLPDGGCFQSMGLPNLGFEAYLRIIPELVRYGKPIFASVSVDDPHEFARVAEMFAHCGASMVTVNTSCPNVGDGKRMLCYDMHGFQIAAMRLQGMSVPINFKLPAYNDPGQIDFVANDIVLEYQIACVTSINGIGQSMLIDQSTDAPVIKATGGFAAFSGPAIKPQTIGNVRRFYEHFRKSGKEVSIIATGGLVTGRDYFDALLCGAGAGKMGQALLRTDDPEDFSAIDRANTELAEILASKGYRSVREAKGKLKRYEE